MSRTLRFCGFLAAVILLLAAQSVRAGEIKDRMIARLPVVNELKAQGVVGENNRGYLEYRTKERPRADVVDAENQDRRTVFQAIAKRQNTTPEFVGQARAAQIADRQAAGTWVQDSSGTWSKK